MQSLTIKNVTFEGYIEKQSLVYARILEPFSHDFLFGKSYLLCSSSNSSGWAISWMIGGLLEPTQGDITKDGIPFAAEIRRRESWYVRKSEIKLFHIGGQSVRRQIRLGLRTHKHERSISETEIIQQFQLTPKRYGRRLDQLSHEAWRASCAIGLANGKRIFCFPYLDKLLIETYRNLWLKEIVEILCTSGAMVLIPATLSASTKHLCDHIVGIDRP